MGVYVAPRKDRGRILGAGRGSQPHFPMMLYSTSVVLSSKRSKTSSLPWKQ